MPRKTSVIAEIIAATQQQQITDREQLKQLRQQAPPGSSPTQLLKKQIDALRITIANGAEDLQDLDTELAEATAFEASEFGRENIARAQEKLKVAEGLINACLVTAAVADAALFQAWAALRRHQATHHALSDALSGAYTSVQAGSGVDPHGDQLQLIHGYARLSNSGVAIAEWVVEALKGYELNNHIQVVGITLNHNNHETLAQADALGLSRCWERLKEIAVRCGVDVHGEGDPTVLAIRDVALNAVQTAKPR